MKRKIYISVLVLAFALSLGFVSEEQALAAPAPGEIHIFSSPHLAGMYYATEAGTAATFHPCPDSDEPIVMGTTGQLFSLAIKEEDIAEGYQFLGWYLIDKDGCDSELAFGSNEWTMVDNSLNCKWVIIRDLLVHEDGTSDLLACYGGNLDVKPILISTEYQICAECSGYGFDGEVPVKCAACTSLGYVVAQPEQKTVRLNMYVQGVLIEEDYPLSNLAEIPAPIVPEGYVFGGWFCDSAFYTPYVFDANVNTELTLFAKLTPIDSSVDNDTDGNLSTISNNRKLLKIIAGILMAIMMLWLLIKFVDFLKKSV